MKRSILFLKQEFVIVANEEHTRVKRGKKTPGDALIEQLKSSSELFGTLDKFRTATAFRKLPETLDHVENTFPNLAMKIATKFLGDVMKISSLEVFSDETFDGIPVLPGDSDDENICCLFDKQNEATNIEKLKKNTKTLIFSWIDIAFVLAMNTETDRTAIIEHIEILQSIMLFYTRRRVSLQTQIESKIKQNFELFTKMCEIVRENIQIIEFSIYSDIMSRRPVNIILEVGFFAVLSGALKFRKEVLDQKIGMEFKKIFTQLKTMVSENSKKDKLEISSFIKVLAALEQTDSVGDSLKVIKHSASVIGSESEKFHDLVSSTKFGDMTCVLDRAVPHSSGFLSESDKVTSQTSVDYSYVFDSATFCDLSTSEGDSDAWSSKFDPCVLMKDDALEAFNKRNFELSVKLGMQVFVRESVNAEYKIYY